jgi:hypothetical protein
MKLKDGFNWSDDTKNENMNIIDNTSTRW